MGIFTPIALLLTLFIFLISTGNKSKEHIEEELKKINSFEKESKEFKLLLIFSKIIFLYDKLILLSTFNILLTSLLIIISLSYENEINCIPSIIRGIFIYIPSMLIVYFSYLYLKYLNAVKTDDILKNDV